MTLDEGIVSRDKEMSEAQRYLAQRHKITERHKFIFDSGCGTGLGSEANGYSGDPNNFKCNHSG